MQQKLLVASALRSTADRIVIGEVRGEEAAKMLEANLNGARGCSATYMGRE